MTASAYEQTEWPFVEIEFRGPWGVAEFDLLAARLQELGSIGWEERRGDPVSWRVYFAPDQADPASRVGEAMRELAIPADLVCSIRGDRQPGQDWMARYRESFQPFVTSRRFAVTPPWFDAAWPFPGYERIVINPGMAFGTGTHETTQLALQGLESCAQPGLDTLDVGVGSAILLIAAARLGARRLVGVDIDELALINARENCSLNGVSGRALLVRSGPAAIRSESFDRIVANILYSNLKRLLADLRRILRPDAESRLILGGFLVSEREEVSGDLARLRLAPVSWDSKGEWGSVIAALA